MEICRIYFVEKDKEVIQQIQKAISHLKEVAMFSERREFE